MNQPDRTAEQVNEAWGAEKFTLAYNQPVRSQVDMLEGTLPPFDPWLVTKDERYTYVVDLIRTFWAPIYDKLKVEVSQEGESTRLLILSGQNHYDKFLPALDPADVHASTLDTTEAIRNTTTGATLLTLFDSIDPNLIKETPIAFFNEFRQYNQDIAGGSSEGLMYIGMALSAFLKSRERTLPGPKETEEFLRLNETVVRDLTELNFFPMKLLDRLVARRVNPFTAEDKELKLNDDIKAYLMAIGHEVVANSSLMALPEDSPEVFAAINCKLPKRFFGDNEDLALGFYQQLLPQVKSFAQNSLGASTTPIDVLKIFKEVVEGKKVYDEDGNLPNKDVIERVEYVTEVMDQILDIRLMRDPLKTYDCPAKGAGIMHQWYKLHSKTLTDWYSLEFKKLQDSTS